MQTLPDAYRKWLGIPVEEQPPNHYRLLAIKLFEADPDVIHSAADLRSAHVKTFQSGEFAKTVQQLLTELEAARLCLINPTRKLEYDTRLKQQLAGNGIPRSSDFKKPAARVVDHSVASVALIGEAPELHSASAEVLDTPSHDAGVTAAGYTWLTRWPRSYLVMALLTTVLLIAVSLVLTFLRIDPQRSTPLASPQPPTPVPQRQVDEPPPKKVLPSRGSEPIALRAPLQVTMVPAVVDDGDPAYWEEGVNWQKWVDVDDYPRAFQGRLRGAPNGGNANWSFTGLPPGVDCRVFATWRTHEAPANNERLFTFSKNLGNHIYRLDAAKPPRPDLLIDGVQFQELGEFSHDGDLQVTQFVQMNDAADAVALVPGFRQSGGQFTPVPMPRDPKHQVEIPVPAGSKRGHREVAQDGGQEYVRSAIIDDGDRGFCTVRGGFSPQKFEDSYDGEYRITHEHDMRSIVSYTFDALHTNRDYDVFLAVPKFGGSSSFNWQIFDSLSPLVGFRDFPPGTGSSPTDKQMVGEITFLRFATVRAKSGTMVVRFMPSSSFRVDAVMVREAEVKKEVAKVESPPQPKPEPKNPADTNFVSNAPPVERPKSPIGPQAFVLVDDADEAFVKNLKGASWGSEATGFRGECRVKVGGLNGGGDAVWSITDLLPGATYDLFATWPPTDSRPQEMYYSVSDGDRFIGMGKCNQKVPPKDDAELKGTNFQIIGRYTTNSGSFVIRIAWNATTGTVADAVAARMVVDEANPEHLALLKRIEPTSLRAGQQPNPGESQEFRVNLAGKVRGTTKVADGSPLATFSAPISDLMMTTGDFPFMVIQDPLLPAIGWSLNAGRMGWQLDTGGRLLKVIKHGRTNEWRLAALGGGSSRLYIWRLHDSSSLDVKPSTPEEVPTTLEDIRAIAFRPGEHAIVVAGRGGVRLLETPPNKSGIDSLRQTASWAEDTEPLNAVAISEDGRQIIAGGVAPLVNGRPNPFASGRLVLIDVATNEVKEIDANQGGIQQIVISPDGKQMFTATDHGVIRVWSLKTKKMAIVRELTGHDGPVHALACSEDGETLVSGGADGSVRVWDSAKGRQKKEFAGHAGPVRSVAVLPKAESAITVGDDGTLRMWPISDKAAPIVARPPKRTIQEESRLEVPSKEELDKARELLQQVFGDKITAANKSAAKRKLAEELRQNSSANDISIAERYVLLEQSQTLAIEAIEATSALAAVEKIAEQFRVNRFQLAAKCLTALGDREPLSATTQKTIASEALRLGSAAIDADELASAKEILAAGYNTIKNSKLGDATLKKQILERGRHVVALTKQLGSVQQARKVLEKQPADPEANLAVGQYLCFFKGQWDEGLPYLGKAENTEWPAIVRFERSVPGQVWERSADLGDAWVKAAESATPETRPAMLRRAIFHLRRAASEAKAAAKIKVQRRIQQLESQLREFATKT